MSICKVNWCPAGKQGIDMNIEHYNLMELKKINKQKNATWLEMYKDGGILRTRMYWFARHCVKVLRIMTFPFLSKIIFVPTSAQGCSKRWCQEFPASFTRWRGLTRFPPFVSWGGLLPRLFHRSQKKLFPCHRRGRGKEQEKNGEEESIGRSLGRFSLIYNAIIDATLARVNRFLRAYGDAVKGL